MRLRLLATRNPIIGKYGCSLYIRYMKALPIIAIVVIVIVILAIVIKSRNSNQGTAALNSVKIIHPAHNPYLGLRKQMLSITPEQIQLQLPKDREVAYGTVLEIQTGGGVATIIAFSTGDASMYISSGGGILGGATHESTKAAAIAFVNEAQKYFGQMPADTSTALPKTGHMKFFIMTNKHRYAIEAPADEVTATNGKWYGLFDKGNDLITQLRLSSK